MKKEQQTRIAGGLDSLLNPTPARVENKTTATEPDEPKTRAYKTVCYNLDRELIDAVKNIAYWDRKKINAVITEALECYIQEWKKKSEK